MKAGTLDKRVTIQAPVTLQDASGQPISQWVDVVRLWAGIGDTSGRELLSADAQQNEVETKITIRYRRGIKPSMRVVHGGTTYSILSVLGQDRVRLLLMCSRLQEC